MLTAEVVEFIMDGVLAGRISRAVARLLVSPYIAHCEHVASGVVLHGAEYIHGFAMTRGHIELEHLDDDFIRLLLVNPEAFEWELSDEEVRVRVEDWRALRKAVGDMGWYSRSEGRWFPAVE